MNCMKRDHVTNLSNGEYEFTVFIKFWRLLLEIWFPTGSNNIKSLLYVWMWYMFICVLIYILIYFEVNNN